MPCLGTQMIYVHHMGNTRGRATPECPWCPDKMVILYRTNNHNQQKSVRVCIAPPW